MHFHLVESALKLGLRPAVGHEFPSLHGTLFGHAFHLHISSHLVHHANQSRLEVILSDRDEVLQLAQSLSLDASLPVPHQSLPIFSLRSPIALEETKEERFVEAIIPMLLFQLVEQGMPHLFIHSLEVGPVEHLFGTMILRPGTLALESDVMHTFHDKLAHRVIEHLALDFAVHHLSAELLHLLASGWYRYLQGKEVNEVILQRILLRIPRHGVLRRIRNNHLPRLAKVAQHLEIILRLSQVFVILILHLINYPYKGNSLSI